MLIEQGPIRPPSEAASLLIRLTRNCPWNKCAFCITYKGKKFSRRTVEEVKEDIHNVKKACDEIIELSRRWGEGGYITPAVIKRLKQDFGHEYLQLAAWLYYGAKTVFLQDANSLIMKTGELVDIIKTIKNLFPSVERITTYARAGTARRKNLEELERLKEAGLSRVHMGLESGSDTVLSILNKGTDSSEMIEAGRKLNDAGISLCFYVILGAGGRHYTREHALETARVINAVNSDFVRFRTLSVIPGTPLDQMVNNNSFETLSEDDIVKEERLLIENLDGIESKIVSDHALNLLEDVKGKLPEEKEKILNIIDSYLNMPYEERLNFQLGRRANIYRFLEDMKEPEKYEHVSRGLNYLKNEGVLEDTIDYLRKQFL